ncbi:MAG: leucine-rich repeat domain-containing protein, partial [Verrucomicrobiae bacterium]|nr:leucine-rich repeat domain-containing protein [Verrucomicrobiae bacterium]
MKNYSTQRHHKTASSVALIVTAIAFLFAVNLRAQEDPAGERYVFGDFEYEILEGQIKITGYTGSDEHVVIPSEIEGLPVKAIGDIFEEDGNFSYGIGYAFNSNKTLKSVVIPDTVESLGVMSFASCEALETVQFSANLRVIDQDAFFYCRALKEVILPDSVQMLGNGAFLACYALEKVRLPANIEKINDRTFFSCRNLSDITLPSSVREIGENAFHSCNKLPSIDLSNIQTLKAGAFSGCFQLENVAIPEDWEVLEDNVFSACTSFTEIQLPKNLKKIGTRTFNGCTNLTEIIIPESVTIIGDEAFRGCKGLTQMTLPDGVSELGKGVFRKCINLTNVVLSAGITELRESSFLDCTQLKNVLIKGQITTIGDESFSGCSSLKSLALPSSLTGIGNRAFAGCPFLETITLGKSVSRIGNYAFAQCSSLKTITFPPMLTHLGEWAFKDCTALTQVYFMGNTPGVPFDPLSLPFEKNYVFSEPYPTLYYLEGTAGWAREYSVNQFGNFIKGDPSSSGRLIIYPGIEVGAPILQKNILFANWWTKGIALETWTLPGDEPEVFVSKRVITENKTQMTLVFGGAL